jgi:tetratricopeptide (TPR) repeat protein
VERRPYETYLRAAALLAQEGDKATAEEVYKQALQVNPTDATLLTTLGQMAAARGDKDAQRAFYARAVESKPDDLDLQRTLAFAYLEKGENTGAERHFNEVLRLKPEDQEAHVAMATLFNAQGKVKETMEHLEEAAALGALDDQAAQLRAQLQKKLMLPLTPPKGKDVNKTFDAALKTIVAAYEARLKDNPKLKGGVTVEVEVGEDGVVKVARLKEDTLKDEMLLANIYFTVKSAQFPAGKKARYSYPITFTGKGGPSKGK